MHNQQPITQSGLLAQASPSTVTATNDKIMEALNDLKKLKSHHASIRYANNYFRYADFRIYSVLALCTGTLAFGTFFALAVLLRLNCRDCLPEFTEFNNLVDAKNCSAVSEIVPSINQLCFSPVFDGSSLDNYLSTTTNAMASACVKLAVDICYQSPTATQWLLATLAGVSAVVLPILLVAAQIRIAASYHPSNMDVPGGDEAYKILSKSLEILKIDNPLINKEELLTPEGLKKFDVVILHAKDKYSSLLRHENTGNGLTSWCCFHSRSRPRQIDTNRTYGAVPRGDLPYSDRSVYPL